MMNPKTLMHLKSLFERFQQNHPKVPPFFRAASERIEEGSVLELTLTTTDGQTLCTNMRVTKDDLEMLQALKSQISKK